MKNRLSERIFQTLKLGQLLTFVSGLCLSVGANANVFEMVMATGESGGDAVWKVVSKSESRDTDLAPGIYTRGAKQNWEHPLVLGSVLGRSNASGLVQLSLTEYTKRLEAFAVVDGRISLFTTSTDRHKPETFITIGEGDAILKDPTHPYLKEINLPPILSLSDVNYLVKDPQSQPLVQEILFSVKNPYSPFQGMDGLTFVVGLNGDAETQDGLELAREVRVLDYQFHTLEQLKAISQEDGYVPGAYIGRLIWPGKDDSPALKVWKERLKHNVETGEFDEVPLFSTKTGEFTIYPLPEFEVYESSGWPSFVVMSRFNPEGGLPTLSFNQRSKSKTLVGQINFIPGFDDLKKQPGLKNLGEYVLFAPGKSREDGMFYLENDLHYVSANGRGEFYIMKLNSPPLDGQIPDQFSFYKLKGRGDDVWFFVSAVKGETTETKIYLGEDNGKDIFLKKVVSLKNYYFDQGQLIQRIYEDEQGLYFDHLSNTESERSYKKSYDETIAHTDVERSAQSESLVIGFRKPVKVDLIGKDISYFQFNQSGQVENANGLYYKESRRKTELLLSGEVLRREPAEQTPEIIPDPVLAKKQLETSLGPVNISVLAMDDTFSHGENGFWLTFLIENQSQQGAPRVEKIWVKQQFAEVSGILFHGGGEITALPEHFLGLMMSFKSKNISVQKQFVIKAELTLSVPDQKSEEGRELRVKLTEKKGNIRNSGANSDVLDQVGPTLLSDVVVRNAKGRIQKVVYGQILTPGISVPNALDKGLLALEKKDFVHPEWGPVGVNVWAVDERFDDGQHGFSLVFKASQSGSQEAEYFVKSFNMPFKCLTGISLMDRSEFGRFKDWFGIIYSLDFNKDLIKTSIEPGFFSLFFKMKNKSPGLTQKQIFFAESTEMQIEKNDHPSMEEMQYKLLMDHEGRLFWPANKNGRSHRLFQVVSLLEHKHLYPNQEKIRLESANSVTELVNYKSDEGKWRVRKAPYMPPLLPGMFGKLDKEDLEEYRNIIFEDLGEHLEDIGNPDSENDHSVLMVSKEVKRYVLNSYAARWLIKKNQSQSAWSFDNRRMALYYMNKDQYLDQDMVTKNFEAMESALDRREKVVLLVDAADILSSAELSEGGVDKPFTIQIPGERSQAAESESNPLYSDVEVDHVEKTASLLYILASEGRHIPLKEFKGKGKSEISISIVATEDEWKEIGKMVNPFERNAGLLKDFKIKSLETPSMEQRRNLLLKILEDKAPLFNGIEFNGNKIFVSHEPMSKEEVRNKIIDYTVSRSQALAMERDENVFVSFVRLLSRFKAALHPGAANEHDGILHVDKAFIENIMRVLYNLTLNLSTLPPNDPLKILDRKDAPLKLNEAGYAGNFDIKMRVIRGILAQTNSGDQKTIPASFVIFGKKGSGKTFLFRTLVKMLGLKYYDFGASDETNLNAQVFMINMGNVTNRGTHSGDSETMGVDTLLQKFDGFLKSPAGSRGFILIDDAHLASSEVRGLIFSKLRSLFEARNGMYQGVSVRNLSLFMTFNPTIDREKINKVVESGKPTPLQLTLATFMGDDNKVDESFFNRWGDIINLDYFSTSAKGNELVNKLSETAKSHFSRENSYFTVSSDVISNIVETFPKLNARDFLSASVKSLLGMLRDGYGYNPLSVVVPRSKIPYRGDWKFKPHSVSGDSASEDVAQFIEENFYGLPVKGDIRGYAWFLEMMTHNYRTNLYRQLVTGLNGSSDMSGSEFQQKHKLSPVLEAIRDHLTENVKIPLTEYTLDQLVIRKNLKLSQFDSINEYFYEMYENAEMESYFPGVFRRSSGTAQMASYLLGSVSELSNQPSRLNLLERTPKALRPALEKYLWSLLSLRDKSDLNPKKIGSWASALKAGESGAGRETGVFLADNLNEFLESFYNNMTMIENMQFEQYEQASFYDVTRIWLYSLDRSITTMAWELPSVWLIRALDTLSQDMSISTASGVQHWLFESGETLIRPGSSESIFESIKSSLLGVGEWESSDRKRFRREFYKKLDNLFYNAKKDI